MVARIEVTSASDSSSVAETTSAPDGSFSLELPAGNYVIVAETAEELPTARIQRLPVTVQSERFQEMVIVFDSGLR